MSFGKCIVRYAVIAGLVGGTAVLVAGPDRLGAVFSQTQNSINAQIDKHIDDPVALRSQMRKLAGQYPERIAAVERDLAELRSQQAQLKQEAEVSERVVSLAAADLDQLRGMMNQVQVRQTGYDAAGEAAVFRIRFDDELLDEKGAFNKARQIGQVHEAYSNRAADIERDLGYISQQEGRLVSLHDQLQQEYTEFQAQMWQMDRQVDTIARNDRLISMMEKRQRTLDQQGRYGAASLDQLAGKFADIRSRQEARLETLGQSTNINSYESRAKLDLDVKRSYRDITNSKPVERTRPAVIEITPGDVGPAAKPAEAVKPIAMRPH